MATSLIHDVVYPWKGLDEIHNCIWILGSSFTKAKPKHGFIKVAKLATIRCILYPFYGYWWIEQTSTYVFFICLIIYVLQIINIGIYCVHTSIATYSEVNNLIYLFFCIFLKLSIVCWVVLFIIFILKSVSCMEIIIPMVMLWVLCLIHSQIVSTSPSNEVTKSTLSHREIRKRNNLKKKRRAEMQEQTRTKKEKIFNIVEKEFRQIEALDSSLKRYILVMIDFVFVLI